MMLLLLSTAPYKAASGKTRVGNFRGGSSVSGFKSSSKFHGGKDASEEGDQVFDGEKRKVYTGPNPLHNR